MGHPDGSLKVQSISGPSDFWLMHPPFGQEPLPLLAEHPAAHASGRRTRRSKRCPRLLKPRRTDCPRTAIVPENLPRPFVDPSPNGVLNLLGQSEQKRAFRLPRLPRRRNHQGRPARATRPAGPPATARRRPSSSAADRSPATGTTGGANRETSSRGRSGRCAFAAPGRSRPAGKALRWSRRRAGIGGSESRITGS